MSQAPQPLGEASELREADKALGADGGQACPLPSPLRGALGRMLCLISICLSQQIQASKPG